MKIYLPQLDYMKSIFILLMILFHLVYIGDHYPYIKNVVYTFHMPIFLILSGYLSSTDKNGKQFIRSVWWLFVPYAIMETGYVLVASFLPVREYVSELNLLMLIARVFIDPIGPYWYLHTLLICRIIHYYINKLAAGRLSSLSFLIVLGMSYWGISESLGIISFVYSMYFLIGIAIRNSEVKLFSLFQPSAWSILPLVILCSKQENLLRLKLSGVCITYLTISLSLWIYPQLHAKVKSLCWTIGRNTLVILLFSPLFTMLLRFYQPFFMFDQSGFCFALFTIPFTIIGCLAIAWGMDKCRISQWFFEKKRALQI